MRQCFPGYRWFQWYERAPLSNQLPVPGARQGIQQPEGWVRLMKPPANPGVLSPARGLIMRHPLFQSSGLVCLAQFWLLGHWPAFSGSRQSASSSETCPVAMPAGAEVASPYSRNSLG